MDARSCVHAPTTRTPISRPGPRAEVQASATIRAIMRRRQHRKLLKAVAPRCLHAPPKEGTSLERVGDANARCQRRRGDETSTRLVSQELRRARSPRISSTCSLQRSRQATSKIGEPVSALIDRTINHIRRWYRLPRRRLHDNNSGNQRARGHLSLSSQSSAPQRLHRHRPSVDIVGRRRRRVAKITCVKTSSVGGQHVELLGGSGGGHGDHP
jgi:hypothetical protein